MPLRGRNPSEQGGFFVAAQHQVEVLHGDAGGALDQVVEAGEDQDPAADDAHGDVAEVGVGRVLGRRQVVDDPDERAVGVERPVELEQVVLDGRAARAWRRSWRRCRGPSARGGA